MPDSSPNQSHMPAPVSSGLNVPEKVVPSLTPPLVSKSVEPPPSVLTIPAKLTVSLDDTAVPEKTPAVVIVPDHDPESSPENVSLYDPAKRSLIVLYQTW